MTLFPHSVDRNAPLSEARQLMDQHAVRHLPVTDGHDLVGIISDRDLRSALAVPPAPHRKQPHHQDLYVPDAYVVDLEEPLEKVLLNMAERHIGSALVTRHGRLAGLFTTGDACRCFGEYLADTFPRPDGNAAA